MSEQQDRRRARAEAIIFEQTVLAGATGAIPVPAASAALVAQNAVLISRVASAMGVPVSLQSVAASMSFATTANLVGKSLFMEGAKLLAWGTGGWALVFLSGLGASTAASQTWLVGHLALAICERGGATLPSGVAADVRERAARRFDAEVRQQI